MDEEWIRPRKLTALLRKHRRDWQFLESMLQPKLSDGSIKARAKHAILYRGHPHRTRTIETDWNIPAQAWKTSPSQASFRLTSDEYSANVERLGYYRVECTGLSFNLAQVLEACEIEADEITEPAQIDLSEYATAAPDAVRRTVDECRNSEWWDYAETMAWIESRDIELVGSVRAWLTYKAQNGKPVRGSLTLNLPGQSDANRDDLLAALRAASDLSISAMGRNYEGALDVIPPAQWMGSTIHCRNDEVYLGPVTDHRFNRFCDLLFRREDVQARFLGSASETSQPTVKCDFIEAEPLPGWYGNPDRESEMRYYHEIAREVYEERAKDFMKVARAIVEREHKDMPTDWKKDQAKRFYDFARKIYRPDGTPKDRNERKG